MSLGTQQVHGVAPMPYSAPSSALGRSWGGPGALGLGSPLVPSPSVPPPLSPLVFTGWSCCSWLHRGLETRLLAFLKGDSEVQSHSGPSDVKSKGFSHKSFPRSWLSHLMS